MLWLISQNKKQKERNMSELMYNAVDKDGIEFYASYDRQTTGMSIHGLARCCGVHRKTIQNILANADAACSNILDPETFAGNVFIDLEGAASENNARIVKSNVCAELITYYAYKSKNAANDVAKETLDKFVKIGIDKWIINAVGLGEPANNTIENKLDVLLDLLLPKIQNIEHKLEILEPVVEEYTNVKDGIRASFRGLETVIEHVKHEQHILPSDKTYTLSEWLETKGIALSHGGLRKLGRTVAETFKTCTVKAPQKKNYRKPNGKWSCNCTAYTEEHFPLLEMALNQFCLN